MESFTRLVEKNKRVILLVLFCIILVIQINNLRYWKEQKGGFFVDEFFTMECVNEYNTSLGMNYMYYSDCWKDNAWMDIDPLQNRLSFDMDKSLFNMPFTWIIKSAFQRNPYFTLLNMFCTGFYIVNKDLSIVDVSIICNILLFVIVQILLFSFVYRLTNDYCPPLAVTIIHGFAGLTISMVEYVRMYMFVELCLLLIWHLTYSIWNEKNLCKQFLYEVILGLVLLFSYNTQGLFAVYSAALVLFVSLCLFATQGRKKALCFFAPFLIGGLIMALKSGLIRAILTTRMDSDGHLGNFLRVLQNGTMSERYELIQYWNDIIWHQVFGARICMLIFLGFVIARIVWIIVKRIKPDSNELFVFILMITAFVFYIFTLVVELSRMRYNQITFISLMTVVVFAAYKCVDELKKRKEIFAVFASMIILLIATYGAIKTRKYTIPENVFAGDAYYLSIVHNEYSDWDNLVYHDTDENGDGHLYDAIYNAGSGTMFRYLTQNDYKDFDAENRDHFLLWTHRGNEFACKQIILSQGYVIENIGHTHISDIYTCTKEN